MVCRPVTSPLEPAQGAVHGPAAPPVAQLVELRCEIPLVEDERAPEQPERCRKREVDVRGAADLQGVEPVGDKDADRQPAGQDEGTPVLADKSEFALPVSGSPVGAQPGPATTLVPGITAADHGDPVAVREQRRDLFLQPVVTGQRDVFHHQQQVRRARRRCRPPLGAAGQSPGWNHVAAPLASSICASAAPPSGGQASRIEPSLMSKAVTEPRPTGTRQLSPGTSPSATMVSRIMTAWVTAATVSPACRDPMSSSASIIRCCASLSRSPSGQAARAGNAR